MSNQPPFLRIELTGEGGEKVILTRQTFDSSQVKIETTARLIYCPPAQVRAALDSMTLAEGEALKGN